MIFDTNFLIALQGRHKRCAPATAIQWIADNQVRGLYITKVVWAEFTAGFADLKTAQPHLARFSVLPMDDEVIWQTSRILYALRAKGIGFADSSIAATALIYGLPIVTENAAHFRRVPGLRVLQYIPQAD